MIDVVPMERNEESFEFALAVKKEAFGPHIMERWGWDERLQRETHAERWAEKRFFRIVRDRESIGVVSIDEAPVQKHRTLFRRKNTCPPGQRQGLGALS